MTVDTVGIIGSGAMGAGIAQSCLASGFHVILYDSNAAALSKAKDDVFARLARLIEKGQLPRDFLTDAERRMTIADSLAQLAPAQMVIEAIVERLEPKRALFSELEGIVAKDAVLATNTSSLSVAAIAAACSHKQRVCGIHFFNPVPVMKLVEVISAPTTSEDGIDRACKLVTALGKTPVKVKDGPGFMVNLGGRAYVTEALHIVQEGVADITTVDRIMRDASGFRMGPFELMDLTGIDVNFPATQSIYHGYQHDPRVKTTTLHELMFNSGRFGRKTGQGFYNYGPDSGAKAEPERQIVSSLEEFCVALPEPTSALQAFVGELGIRTRDDADVSLIAPVGEDAATIAARLRVAPSKLVAIDLIAINRKFVTLMAPLGNDGLSLRRMADGLRGQGLRVETVKDSPGFVVQRILAMIANLGCEMAQIGIGTPEDIDLAMKLALNYPQGPLEFAQTIGLGTTHSILTNIQMVTGSDRYRPSLWLRRRAMLGRSIYERDCMPG
jgi:3-hydroxybutyryl-CoA dehydrogenase